MIKIDKSAAFEAWETLNDIIDRLDWSGAFIDNELNDIESSMATLLNYIKQEED